MPEMIQGQCRSLSYDRERAAAEAGVRVAHGFAPPFSEWVGAQCEFAGEAVAGERAVRSALVVRLAGGALRHGIGGKFGPPRPGLGCSKAAGDE